jgi:hypothetical protein
MREVAVALLAIGMSIPSIGCCRVGPAEGSLPAAVLEDERRAQAAYAGSAYDARVVHPFVVVAEGRVLGDQAETTISWATSRLRADFFDREPGKPITIWVFGSEASYMSGTSALLGTIPDTPYGFYRPCKRALVVNAGSGWGTLVHEVVHAFIDADFPSAPAWMNEGLASLFEAPVEVDGHIRGATNWRLPALKQAIVAGQAPSFRAMAEGSRGDFNGDRGHLYYATARYLFFWLQDQGLLESFYRSYRARSAVDGAGVGLDVLREVTRRDLHALRAEWETFVSNLSAPRAPERNRSLRSLLLTPSAARRWAKREKRARREGFRTRAPSRAPDRCRPRSTRAG